MTVSEACSYHLGRGIRKDDLLLPFSHWVASFVTPWTAAHQAPPPTEFPRQECWRGCHFLLQSIFPTQGSNPRLLCFLPWQADSLPLSQGLLGFLPWQADSLPLSHRWSPWKDWGVTERFYKSVRVVVTQMYTYINKLYLKLTHFSIHKVYFKKGIVKNIYINR